MRFLGCTGHAFDMAVVFGDEIEMRAESMQADFANPFDMMRLMITHAGPGTAGVQRLRSVLAVLAGGKKAAELNFRAACEVADVFAKRLDLDEDVRAALAASFERWNGRGLPTGAKGTAIPRPMRIAQLSQELEVLARIEGIDRALTIIRKRRGKAYDPELTDLVARRRRRCGGTRSSRSIRGTPRSRSPRRPRRSSEAAAHEALLVLADFSDLKSPWLGGHSRAVATLAGDGVRARCRARRARARPRTGRRSRTRCGTSPSALTRDERDRAEMHALVTDQLLRRLPYTARLADIAGAAHERVDGSGYHRRVNRRAPRRRATRARRRRLLSGHDLRSSAPRRTSVTRPPRPSSGR